MGMDVDFIVAKDSLKEIDGVLFDMEHGERQDIADEIIEFAEKIKKKYGKKS